MSGNRVSPVAADLIATGSDDDPPPPYNDAVRLVGVDPGGARLGLAVADDTSGVVAPLEVLAYRGVRAAAEAIAARAAGHGAELVVVGLPTAADGSDTPACRRSRALARELAALGLAVALQPEFLTTDEARRRAREAGRRVGRPVDDLAAQVILEEFLSADQSSPVRS